MRNKLFISCGFWLISFASISQTDISMATHWYNRGNYNPASIARTDYLYLFSNVRKQWLGTDGSPMVYNIEISGYNSSLNSAFGLSIVNDQIGITNSTNPMLSYAFRIANNSDWSLSFGLSLGVFYRAIDVSQYSAENPVDNVLYNTLESTIKPDANFGIEFNSSHFILGLSTTHLFSINKTDNIYLNASHRYLYGIYKNMNSEVVNYYLGLQMINYSSILLFEPNITLRFKAPTGGLQNNVKELFDVGISYRTSKMLTFLFGVNLSNQFRVGYAYEQTFHVGYNKNGTHEIMLEYRIPLKSAECKVCYQQEDWYR